MTRFLFKLVLFVLPLALAVAALEFGVRSIPNDYAYKNGYLEQNAADLEILVLGSSHTFFGIDPEHFSVPAFNAAHVSQTFNYDYLIFDKFSPVCTNLQAVVIPVSLFSLYSSLEDSLENWRIKYYNLYYGRSHSASPWDRFEIIGTPPLTLIEQVARYTLSGGRTTKRTVSELGFGVKFPEGHQIDLAQSGIWAAERHMNAKTNRFEENLAYLERIVADCQARGVDALLFTPPAYSSYVENLSQEKIDLLHSTVDSIVAKYPNAAYHDLLADQRFLEADFADGDHMNKQGAQKLTRIIDDLLQPPSS